MYDFHVSSLKWCHWGLARAREGDEEEDEEEDEDEDEDEDEEEDEGTGPHTQRKPQRGRAPV